MLSIRIASVCLLVVCACAKGHDHAGQTANRGAESIVTSLNAHSCKEEIDKSDPNDTSYLVCPGVAGYQLQVRKVESGRMSINVVNPAKREIWLNYDDVVTRSMCSLDDKAEWRVRKENGKLIPTALIVRVMAYESQDDPIKVTSIYFAIAKIAADGACVTDRIRQGSRTEAEVRALADSAASRACARKLPAAH